MLGYVRLECEQLVHASKRVCRSHIVNINRTISMSCPLNLLQKYIKNKMAIERGLLIANVS